jgi:hypothetical protein
LNLPIIEKLSELIHFDYFTVFRFTQNLFQLFPSFNDQISFFKCVLFSFHFSRKITKKIRLRLTIKSEKAGIHWFSLTLNSSYSFLILLNFCLYSLNFAIIPVFENVTINFYCYLRTNLIWFFFDVYSFLKHIFGNNSSVIFY